MCIESDRCIIFVREAMVASTVGFANAEYGIEIMGGRALFHSSKLILEFLELNRS